MSNLLIFRYLILALAFFVYPDDVSEGAGVLSKLMH